MLPSRKIIVKHDELHPQIKSIVKDLLETRKIRNKDSLLVGLIFGAAGSVIGKTGGSFIDDFNENLLERAPLDFPWMLASAGSLAAFGIATEYTHMSKEVNELHRQLATALKLRPLKKDNSLKVQDLKDTHPLVIVDRKGNLHFIPKTTYQRAVARAQETFLGKLGITGRKRINLEKQETADVFD